MPAPHIRVHRAEIARFCQQNGIRKLSLFGSVLTARFSSASDIDILVEFEPGRPVGYLGLSALERELSGLFGRRVDLRTPDELSPYFRDAVLKAARIQYARE